MNVAAIAALFSVIVPAKMWFSPSAPLNITADQDVKLVLTDFAGKAVEAKADANVNKGQTVDVRAVFPSLASAGTFVLYAVPRDKNLPDFVGTPIVIGVRDDKRPGAAPGPQVIKMEPLRYVTMATENGDMTWVFWYDVAPNTVSTILTLAEQGYYDGLTFHRVVPGFVIQGGDPRGDGSGGPGFMIDAEFSPRKHVAGVLSMARNGDPEERMGRKPRCEWANSAGSQFFICVADAAFLNEKYTAFGEVVEGFATAAKAIEATPLADRESGRPVKPPGIKKAEVKNVTAEKNPYATLLGLKKPQAAAQ